MTTTTVTPHVLVVIDTCPGHPGEAHDSECIEYSIECPGVTEQCRMWQECDVKDCVVDEKAWGSGPVTLHGVEHGYIADEWMVPTGKCFVKGHDYLREAAPLIAEKPGRYPVGYDFDDGTCLILTAVPS